MGGIIVNAPTTGPTVPDDPSPPDDQPEGPARLEGSRSWLDARRAASEVADDPERAETLLAQTAARLRTTAASRRLAGVMDELEAALRMARLRLRGEYGAPGIERLVLLFAALLYVVNPMDVVPDAIPAAGLMDDATVVTWMLVTLREELQRFRLWEATHEPPPEDPGGRST